MSARNIVWSKPELLEEKTDCRGKKRQIMRLVPLRGATYPYASKRQIERQQRNYGR